MSTPSRSAFLLNKHLELDARVTKVEDPASSTYEDAWQVPLILGKPAAAVGSSSWQTTLASKWILIRCTKANKGKVLMKKFNGFKNLPSQTLCWCLMATFLIILKKSHNSLDLVDKQWNVGYPTRPNTNNGYIFHEACHVSNLLSISHSLLNFILTSTLSRRDYRLHYKAGNWHSERFSNFPKVR